MAEWTAFETELGWIALAWTPRGLSLLRVLGGAAPAFERSPEPPWVRGAIEALERHLAGGVADLEAIPLDLEGLSPFARRVLEALRTTRPGETLTYGMLARRAGSPGAARAVGRVLARNPLPILVPCHRVVASDGPGGHSLFGSAEAKARLLALECDTGA